jgi:pyruvate dehydrogenase E2 component (dihydrolipoamide acetyltransferase)
MALVAQEIPKVGLVMEAVKVVRWLKNVGDTVTLGEPLVEVETEKSVIEIEATASGRLMQILVQAEQEATVGDRLAWIETGTASPTSAAAEAEAPPVAGAPPIEESKVAPPRPTYLPPVSPPPAAFDARAAGRIRSSPVARKLAAERGLDLATIAGTGPGGRIQLDDVRRVIESPAKIAVPSPVAPSPVAGLQRLSPMRRALARAMTLSNATVPQFTVERSVDWTELQALRAQFSARLAPGAPRPSVTDFLLQAVARTLIEIPALNATFWGDPESPDAGVLPASGAHIGLVLAVENGLLVPVIHHVERLGVAELARRRVDCVDRGLKGRLKREEVDGATFSISNLGAQGPDRFTAIINPPQSAILAVGRQRDCVVVKDAQIVIRPLSVLTLTVDHRIADGRLASEFLARLVGILEGRDWRFD